jgi:hypothetical protein
MYSSSEWVSGQTTATILATIGGMLLVCHLVAGVTAAMYRTMLSGRRWLKCSVNG